MIIPVPRKELMLKAALQAADEQNSTEGQMKEILDPLFLRETRYLAEKIKNLLNEFPWMDQATAFKVVDRADDQIGRHVGNVFGQLAANFADEFMDKVQPAGPAEDTDEDDKNDKDDETGVQ